MNKVLRSLLIAAGILVAGQAAAQVTFYEDDGFNGRSFTTDRRIGNFERFGFNDRASSASVRGGTWEVCTDARFEGRCATLRPGDYPSLRAMGLNDRISSVREVTHYGNAPRHEDHPNGYSRDYYDRNNYDRNNWDRR